MKSIFLQVESHRVVRFWKQVRFSGKNLGAVSRLARNNCRRSAVSEEDARDDVRLSETAPLKRETRQFNSDQQNILPRARLQEFMCARKCRSPGRATEFGYRQAPNVPAETHVLNEVGFERWNHEAR